MSEKNLPTWIGALSTSYSIEILEATGQPKSAAELSRELDAPIATVYRRLEELVESDLLTQDGSRVSDDGRQEKVYRRTIDGFSLEFRMDALVVETNAHSEARAALAETWDAMRQTT